MLTLYRGTNSKGRRKYARFLARTGSPIPKNLKLPNRPFRPNEVVRIMTNDYGVSYMGMKASIVSYDEQDNPVVKIRKRKSPLIVKAEHLQKVTEVA